MVNTNDRLIGGQLRNSRQGHYLAESKFLQYFRNLQHNSTALDAFGKVINMTNYITKTIQARRTRRAGHCWRSKNELISDVLQWTPAYGQAKVGRPARTYIMQLCEDTGCSPEGMPEAMNDREKWRERAKDIRASGTT